jgi:hypothetical protein
MMMMWVEDCDVTGAAEKSLTGMDDRQTTPNDPPDWLVTHVFVLSIYSTSLLVSESLQHGKLVKNYYPKN